MFSLRLLGGLSLQGDRTTLTGPATQRHRLALLALLAVSGSRTLSRDKLIALLWPERDVEHARNLLNQGVHALRRAIGEAAIISTQDELRLDPAAVVCDAVAFEAALAAGELERAIELYTGPFLDGFHLPATSEFEHWADGERDRLRRSYMRGLESLAKADEAGGAWSSAVERWRSLASEEPYNARVTLRLMRALDAAGDPAGSLQQARLHTLLLQQEFEGGPDPEIVALSEQLRTQASRPFGTQSPAAQNHQTQLAPEIGDGRAETAPPPRFLSPAGSRAADPPRQAEVERPAPAGDLISVSASRRVPRAAALLTAAAAFLLLLGIAGLYLGAPPGGRSVALLQTTAIAASPAIAVLPFASNDRQLAFWREGLVDLVSLDLSGIPGLRAVDSRALLVRWRGQVATGSVPDVKTALDVAERTGARYAVLGSVIARGPDLLLTGAVHELAGGQMLGTARSQGPADSIFALVDRFALEIIRLIPRGYAQELSQIDLAGISTSSLPALRSYLEGEVLFRHSQFEDAAESYARAVEADSTFALARYRLGLSREWFWNDIKGSAPDPLGATVGPFADRLPQHEGALFRAIHLREQDVRAAREIMEEEVRRHPDDAETWYQLGELYYHVGDEALVPRESADRAFAKSIELDSTFSLSYIHRIDYAMNMRDTAGAARLLGTYARLAPQSRYLDQFRLAAKLAFGDSAAHSATDPAFDTLDNQDLFGLGMMLAQQGRWDLSEQVFRRARERAELRSDATLPLFFVSLAQGKTREAHGWVNDPFMPDFAKALMLQVLEEVGAAIPTVELDSGLSRGSLDSADAVQLFSVGSYAASRARWQETRSTLQHLQVRAQRLNAAGDGSEAAFTEAVRHAVEGYTAWRRGDLDAALRLLQRSQPWVVGDRRRAVVNMRLRWWLGRLLLEMGRPREALPYFESLTMSWVPADYERAQIYEHMGMVERARKAYAAFLAQYGHADPSFQVMVQDARAALRRTAFVTRK
jgi:DNA-binding SARP family transcriptional activator/TolB-like protein